MSYLVLIFGSRGWRDGQPIYERLVRLDREHEGEEITVVQGGATGADQLARGWAWKLGMGVLTVRPDWRRYKMAAGYKRNEKMADLGPREAFGFWDGKSKGSKHMIEILEARGIPYEIWRPGVTVPEVSAGRTRRVTSDMGQGEAQPHIPEALT